MPLGHAGLFEPRLQPLREAGSSTRVGPRCGVGSAAKVGRPGPCRRRLPRRRRALLTESVRRLLHPQLQRNLGLSAVDGVQLGVVVRQRSINRRARLPRFGFRFQGRRHLVPYTEIEVFIGAFADAELDFTTPPRRVDAQPGIQRRIQPAGKYIRRRQLGSAVQDGDHQLAITGRAGFLHDQLHRPNSVIERIGQQRHHYVHELLTLALRPVRQALGQPLHRVTGCRPVLPRVDAGPVLTADTPSPPPPRPLFGALGGADGLVGHQLVPTLGGVHRHRVQPRIAGFAMAVVRGPRLLDVAVPLHLQPLFVHQRQRRAILPRRRSRNTPVFTSRAQPFTRSGIEHDEVPADLDEHHSMVIGPAGVQDQRRRHAPRPVTVGAQPAANILPQQRNRRLRNRSHITASLRLQDRPGTVTQRAPIGRTRRRQPTPVTDPEPEPAEHRHPLRQTVTPSETGPAADPGAMGGPRQHLLVARRIAVSPTLDVGAHAAFCEPGSQARDFVGPSSRLAADDLTGEVARRIDLQLTTEHGIHAELLGEPPQVGGRSLRDDDDRVALALVPPYCLQQLGPEQVGQGLGVGLRYLGKLFRRHALEKACDQLEPESTTHTTLQSDPHRHRDHPRPPKSSHQKLRRGVAVSQRAVEIERSDTGKLRPSMGSRLRGLAADWSRRTGDFSTVGRRIHHHRILDNAHLPLLRPHIGFGRHPYEVNRNRIGFQHVQHPAIRAGLEHLRNPSGQFRLGLTVHAEHDEPGFCVRDHPDICRNPFEPLLGQLPSILGQPRLDRTPITMSSVVPLRGRIFGQGQRCAISRTAHTWPGRISLRTLYIDGGIGEHPRGFSGGIAENMHGEKSFGHSLRVVELSDRRHLVGQVRVRPLPRFGMETVGSELTCPGIESDVPEYGVNVRHRRVMFQQDTVGVDSRPENSGVIKRVKHLMQRNCVHRPVQVLRSVRSCFDTFANLIMQGRQASHSHPMATESDPAGLELTGISCDIGPFGEIAVTKSIGDLDCAEIDVTVNRQRIVNRSGEFPYRFLIQIRVIETLDANVVGFL